jgi:hypothetical protein
MIGNTDAIKVSVGGACGLSRCSSNIFAVVENVVVRYLEFRFA